jgi:hypothetical protein
MATNSAVAGQSQPDSEESGGESTESEVLSHSASQRYEISDPEDEDCDLGDGKELKTRQRATWECVKEWDPRVVEQDVIGQEILDLSNHYMQLSGTDELAGYFKNNAIRLGMWPRKSVQTRPKGITRLFIFSTSFIKGFALTLSLGILVSLFSAIFITRILLMVFIGQWAEKAKWLL